VTTADLAEQLAALNATLSNIEAVLDLAHLRKEQAALEEQASAPDLWNDPAKAQVVTSRLSHVQSDINRVERLRSRLDDATLMYDLAQSEEDADAEAEVVSEIAILRKAIDELEVRTLLSGEYDAARRWSPSGPAPAGWTPPTSPRCCCGCTCAGPSGTATAPRCTTPSYAEEAGLKSATFAVKAPYAYGTLSVEAGTHRLVRISPFDNQGRRQTSFAAVEVVPVVEQTDEIEIPDDDLRVDVYRSSGPGGQGVNTTDSAVRLTHLPTGIVVSCQNERSQLQNKASAMAVLKAKLLDRKRAEEAAQMDVLRGDVAGSWGDQMRSYVLHPYQMVKDLRTEYETGNPSAVFDGEIDLFIEAGIRWRRRRQMGTAA
jgi:peptide chain release factor 2